MSRLSFNRPPAARRWREIMDACILLSIPSPGTGRLARPQINPANVRGPAGRRRLPFQHREALHQRVEPSDQRHQMGGPGTVPLHHQHQSGQEQSRHASR